MLLTESLNHQRLNQILVDLPQDDFKVHTVESNGFKVITADFAPQEAPHKAM